MMTKAMFLAGALALAISTPAQTPKFDPASNNPPPVGAILDLAGTPVPGGGNNTYQQYSVNFTASIPNTDITFAFREDPAFISFSKASVTDVTTPSGELLVNGDFSQGPVGTNTPIGWTYANEFGAVASGVVRSGCGVGLPGPTYGVGNCWFDGAVLAYDAISQTITTIPGHTYQITFFVADNSFCNCNFSDLSSPGVSGINVTVYAQAGLPAPAGATTGAQLTINGALNSAAPVPIFATITDSQIHSGSFHTVPTGAGGEDNCTAADQVSTDAYLMQGGSPTGCDPGNVFEGALGTGSATVSGFAVTTKYVVWTSGPVVCNTNNTICIGAGNPSNDTSFMTVTNNNTGHNFTGTIGVAGTALNPSTCLPSGTASDSVTFNSNAPFAAGASWTFAISTDASACGGLQPTQIAPPQQINAGQPNQVPFNAAANNVVIHNVIWAGNLQFNNGVNLPQLSSENIILSTDPTIGPFLKFTPWAVAQLFEKAGDDVIVGGAGFGSLYRDKCFQAGADPSTATEQNCPVGAGPTDFIQLSDTFDQPNPKPDITPGTTVSLIHHPRTAQTITQPSDTWSPVPSNATSNPVCPQVQTSGATFDCELEDILTYDPATFPTTPGGVSGDETTIGGRSRGRGTMGSLFKVPMLQTAGKVNTTLVSSFNLLGGEVQGTQQYWFNSHTLNLDFLVNPAQTPSPSNGWFAAPIQSLAYIFFSNLTTEPLLPDPPNCVDPAVSTCHKTNGTPGAFTNGVAAPVDFMDSLTSVSDGLYTLAWSACDTVQICERNIQLLHSLPTGSNCPNPFNLSPAPVPPCYSTTLFSAQIGVDTKAPTVTGLTLSTTSPTPGQIVTASYACNDQPNNNVASGMASCGTHTGLGGVLNTGTLNSTFTAAGSGPQSYPVTATDVAGNSFTLNANYSVPLVVLIGPSSQSPFALAKDSNGNFVVIVTVLNRGNVSVDTLTVTGATLGTTPLSGFTGSATIHNLAPGQTAQFTINFSKSAGADNATVPLKLQGTYGAGTSTGNWTLSFRGVKLP